MNILELIFENADELIGVIVIICALVVSCAAAFTNPSDNRKKILGTMFVAGIVLIARDQWIYLLGLVVIGTLITGPELMIEIIKAIKTSRTENSNENIESLQIGNTNPK